VAEGSHADGTGDGAGGAGADGAEGARPMGLDAEIDWEFEQQLPGHDEAGLDGAGEAISVAASWPPLHVDFCCCFVATVARRFLNRCTRLAVYT
jgi:hypothetical protein